MNAIVKTDSTPYRIKDLVEKTGVSKETIHFYILEGLLPKAHKTARNMAWYGEEHVERLKTIKDLQEKQFLPLKAIKAVLGDQQDYQFTADQKRTIAAIQARLTGNGAAREKHWISYRDLGARHRVKPWELDEMEAAGVINVDRSGRGARVDADDEEIVRLWVALREIGFGPEHGFGPRDLEMMETFVSLLFDEEVKLLTSRVDPVDSDEAARMVEQAVPKVNELLALLHVRKVRHFLTAYDANETTIAPPRRTQ